MERLSGLDASFLYAESSTVPLNVCSVVELDTSTMPGGYTFDRFHDDLALRIKALPEFRAKLADSQLTLDHPVWVEDKDFDLSRHLQRIDLPSPGGRRELAEVCGHLAAAQLDRSKPVWEMWVIEGVADTDAREGGPLALMVKVHHAAVDGVSATNLLTQLCSPEPEFACVMSVRGIGEGHISSIGFRTGVVDGAGGVTLEDPAPFAAAGTVVPTLLDGAVIRSELRRLHGACRRIDVIAEFPCSEAEELVRLGVAARAQVHRLVIFGHRRRAGPSDDRGAVLHLQVADRNVQLMDAVSVGKRAYCQRYRAARLRANMLDQKENAMTSPTTFRTPYDLRVELVRDTIRAHSKLGDKAAGELAVHVLHALNSIPEKMR